MSFNESKGVKIRILLVAILYLGLFGVMIVRSYQLQLFNGDELGARAERQLASKVPFQPVRGMILDRNGEELAVSRDLCSIYAQPSRISDPERVAEMLQDIMGENKKKIAQKLSERKHFVWIKRGLPIEAMEQIESLGIKGVGSIKESRRYYPNMELAGQLIGFAGIDSQGLEGIELEYDKYIKGKPGFFMAERDALGRNIYSMDMNGLDSSNGHNITMTINKTIQHIAERELGAASEKYNAKGGMALVMDPRSGELLAMAVSPGFNPNTFEKSKPFQWRNRLVTDTFEPGSTFKIFLAAAALDSGKVGPQDIFFCENGRIRVYDKYIHDAGKHGWLSLGNILKVSSNIGAYKVADKIGKEEFYKYILKFGFGKKTGIDLPGERSGSLREVTSLSPVGFANVSFGQGLSVTAIQLVNAMAAVANGGYLMKPYIVKSVTDREGKTIYSNSPVIRTRVISGEAASTVTSILKNVVAAGGSGARAAIDGYEVAGKTGTSQKYDVETGRYHEDKYISSFIGFVPADDPELAILVLLDEPKEEYYGGRVAAPVFRKIAEQSLAHLKVAPLKERGLMAGASVQAVAGTEKMLSPDDRGRFAAEGEIKVMPELRGLTLRGALSRMWGSPSGVNGSGFVVEQSPAPGEKYDAQKGYSLKLGRKQGLVASVAL